LRRAKTLQARILLKLGQPQIAGKMIAEIIGDTYGSERYELCWLLADCTSILGEFEREAS